LIILFYL
jgi:hypothetical protein